MRRFLEFLRRHPIFSGILVFLIVLRLVLPTILLRKLNHELASLDGPVCGHVEDLDLRLIAGGYRLQGVNLFTRPQPGAECKTKVLSMNRMSLSIAWSELIRGKARLHVRMHEPEIAVDPLIAAIQSHPTAESRQELKKGAQNAADALIPWRIDALKILDGRAYFILFGQGGISAPLEHLNAEVTGIESGTATGRPVLYRAKASVFGSASVIAAGSFTMDEGPARWDVDLSAEKVDLTRANPFLYNRVPMTFTTGKLDLFGEAAGKGTQGEGYLKVLFTNIDVVSSKERWKNFKQAVVEVVGSLFFIVAKSPESRNVGTILVFKRNSTGFDIDWAGALARSISHSNGKRVQPGIENRLELPKP